MKDFDQPELRVCNKLVEDRLETLSVSKMQSVQGGLLASPGQTATGVIGIDNTEFDIAGTSCSVFSIGDDFTCWLSSVS